MKLTAIRNCIIEKLRKYKLLSIIILMLFCFIVGIIFVGISYFRGGATGSFIKKTEHAFDSCKIEYEEILYFHPFIGGPQGKGDGFIVIVLTDKSKQEFDKYAENSLYKLPMPQKIKKYAYNVMNNEKFSYTLPELEQGYYGLFSTNGKQVLNNSEIEKNLAYIEEAWDCDNYINSSVTIEDILLDSCIYIQYENEKGILYIWEYSR